jgi:8-oxo-dGTP diphosphatase
MKPDRFNVRVYFLCISTDGRQVLVSDEIIKGRMITKFPGGGLEFGEGTIDCVHREALEELGQEVSVTDHFYTTDFYLPSAFHANHQVISIYYTASLRSAPVFRIAQARFQFAAAEEGAESFRWVSLDAIEPAEFELPADQIVAQRLSTRSRTG